MDSVRRMAATTSKGTGGELSNVTRVHLSAEPARPFEWRVHSCRAARRHCNHRHSHRAASARGASRTRSEQANAVSEQSATNWFGFPILLQLKKALPASWRQFKRDLRFG